MVSLSNTVNSATVYGWSIEYTFSGNHHPRSAETASQTLLPLDCWICNHAMPCLASMCIRICKLGMQVGTATILIVTLLCLQYSAASKPTCLLPRILAAVSSPQSTAESREPVHVCIKHLAGNASNEGHHRAFSSPTSIVPPRPSWECRITRKSIHIGMSTAGAAHHQPPSPA